MYGYFIRRENDEIKEEKAQEEEIVIDAKSLMRCVSELHLSSGCIIRVDTAGIVQHKSSTSITKSP